MTDTGGVVVCGGQSKRMGRPKAWLPVGGELMLHRVVRAVGRAVSPVVVVAAADQPVPDLPAGVELVRDEVGGRGPLAGLAAGLAALHGRVSGVYLSACDVPFLREEFVRRVVTRAGQTGRLIVAPEIDGRCYPLAAAYKMPVLAVVRRMIGEGRLRMTDLFTHTPTLYLPADELRPVDPDLESLVNINTPDEYREHVGDWSGPAAGRLPDADSRPAS